jgi:uncharacterized protein YdaU (DUF1376 family)
MSGLPWVKWYADKFLNGIADLEPNEIAVYAVVLNLIYDAGGPIADDVAKIARRCNMRPTSCAKALEGLQAAGKLVRSGGAISNDRAEKELKSRQEVSEKSAKSAAERWKKSAEKSNKNNDGAMRTQCEGTATAYANKTEIQTEETGSIEPVARARQEHGDFPAFWLRYPAKVGRGAAEKSYAKAIKAGATHAELMAGLDAYIANKPPDREWCHASTWLNQARWTDEWPSHPSQPRSRHDRARHDEPSRVGTLLAGLADAAGLDARGNRRDPAPAAWDGPELDATPRARDDGFELRSLPLAGSSAGGGAGHRATVHGFPRRASFAG